jgi:glucose-6-phosphate dehydrogenase assembly protein OpcA
VTEELRPISQIVSELESQLDGLWRNETPEAGAVHAHTLNLVAVCGAAAGGEFLALVNEVSMRLAARTFLLRVDARPDRPLLQGEVSAVCRKLQGDAEPSVCAERLELDVGNLTPQRIRSILDALLEARLPMILYVGPAAPAAVVGAIAKTAAGVVLDSALHGVVRSAELCARSRARVHDLAFVRGRRWRELIARFFDDPRLTPALTAIRALEVEYVPANHSRWPSAEAELLVSWLATRLGWRSEMGELVDGSGNGIEVALSARDAAPVGCSQLMSVSLRAELGRGTVLAKVERRQDGEHLEWSVHAEGICDARQRLLAPRRSAEELAARAVSDVEFDPLAREALAFANAWARAS